MGVDFPKIDQETVRQSTTLSRLLEISIRLLGHLELDPLLYSIASNVTEILNADSGGIYRFDSERGELVPVFPIKQPKEALYTIKPGEGLAGKVLQSGQPMSVEDYDNWAGRTEQQPRGIVGPVMQAPVKSGEDLFGVVYVERRVGRPAFTDEDLESLMIFANYAAIAVSNVKLYEESKRAAAELSSLYDTSLELTRQLAVQEVLEHIVQRAKALVNGEFAQFYQFDKDQNMLLAAFPENFPPNLSGRMQLNEGLSGKVFSSRKPLIIEDYDRWEGRAYDTPQGLFTRAIGVPVEHRKAILGVLSLTRSSAQPPFNATDLRVLTLFANQAAVALTNAQQYEELQKLYAQVKEKEKLESELRIAHSMQASLLPKRLPQAAGWEFAAMWNAAQVISGDFYDVFKVYGGKIGFVIADVVGKGVGAALFMALCRTLTRTLCIDGGRPPRVAISRVNDLILADSYSDWFCTLCYGALDPKTGEFTFVNAGHPRPLWVHAADKKVETLQAKGVALGIMPSIELEEKTIQLEPGDSLFMYTDGLTEAQDSSGDFFGERRIKIRLNEMSTTDPKSVLNRFHTDIQEFSRGHEAADDLTAILIKRNKAD